jgi:hypothetical protein
MAEHIYIYIYIGEKARWFSIVLEPFRESRDMAIEMGKHNAYMEVGYRKLMSIIRDGHEKAEVFEPYHEACQEKFSWWDRTKLLAADMEKRLCPRSSKKSTVECYIYIYIYSVATPQTNFASCLDF